MLRKLFALLLFTTTFTAAVSSACSPRAMEPRGSMVAVDQRVAWGFAAARTALVALDTAEVFYLEEGTQAHRFKADDPAFDASAKRIAALQAIRSGLELLRTNLTKAEPHDLKSILVDLERALEAAQAAGVPIPKDVAPSLKTLREVLL